MKNIFLIILSGYLSLFADIHVQSSEQQNVMIELYSSQGCSSCPPAEEWLNRFTTDPQLWKRYIPLNFHVDYWDRLGWKDPFAKPAYTQRQSDYRKNAYLSAVYTPGFLINSKEYRGWFKQEPLSYVRTKKAGILSLSLNKEQMHIKYSKKGDYQVNIALLGFGMKSKVSRGENRGKTLKHDFVVLELHSQKMPNSGLYLPLLHSTIHSEKYALVIWISSQNSLQVIQSIGTWI